MFETIDFKIGSRHRDANNEGRLDRKNLYLGPPLIDTKKKTQENLAGDKEVVMYCDKNARDASSYQNNLKGLQVPEDRQATILDYNRQSFI